MKTCPYCAEEIQDAAIKCRYCQSWLVDEIPASAETPPAGVAVHEPAAAETSPAAEAAEEAAEMTETAAVQAEEPPTEAPEPAAEAPTEEPPTEVVEPAAEAPTEEPPTEVVASTVAASAPAPAAAAPSEPSPEWTHSGELYLLGYTDAYFGIWDRRSPTAPTERFPRTDDGWRQAWQRYAALERNWMDLRTGQRSS